MRIEVVLGDITTQHVDAVVTAANRSLVGGSGVNRAVHAAAGPRLLAASQALAPCPAGSAVVTPAYDLRPARWVIHAVGPRYADPDAAAKLASAYRASLSRAGEVGARSIAFPAISTGVYGYPAHEAAAISVEALRQATTKIDDVLLVAFNRRIQTLWERALDQRPD